MTQTPEQSAEIAQQAARNAVLALATLNAAVTVAEEAKEQALIGAEAASAAIIPHAANIIPTGGLDYPISITLCANAKGSETIANLFAQVVNGTGTADVSILKNGTQVYGPVSFGTTPLEDDPGFSIAAGDTIQALVQNPSGVITQAYVEVYR